MEGVGFGRRLLAYDGVVNARQKARIYVYSQLSLLALLMFWPADKRGFGFLDFLFEFVGVLSVFGGLALIFFAIRSLFTFSLPKFSGTPKDKFLQSLQVVWPKPLDSAKLVTSGVFKRMRHPIYAGLLLLAYGIGIGSGPTPHLFFAIALQDRKSVVQGKGVHLGEQRSIEQQQGVR